MLLIARLASTTTFNFITVLKRFYVSIIDIIHKMYQIKVHKFQEEKDNFYNTFEIIWKGIEKCCTV